ncbi:MAG: hypothetical protein ACE5HQ_00970 [Gemmatimonadota bacterium]
MQELVDLSGRSYPQTWILVDVARREPKLVGHEIVDLSPGAIELRQVARSLRAFGEQRERWLKLGPKSPLPRLSGRQRHQLSFGPTVAYCVEHDESRTIHRGRPFRHLALALGSRLTPATSAEIGLYFYGRRPAVFGFTAADSVHGYIGMMWEPLSARDVQWLLERDMRTTA